jgi:DNA polymerase III epsilon subunit-like protein
MREFLRDMDSFDKVIVWYGKNGSRRHDIPFLRSRCLLHGLGFPRHKEKLVSDGYDIARYKLKLHSNRLESMCDFFGIESKGHKLKPDIWQRALSGDKKSLDYIWEHNIEDVVSLEEVWKKISEFDSVTKTSI